MSNWPLEISKPQTMCVRVCFFPGDTCASDCRMKEHLVWFDPPRWGDVRSVIEDRRRVLQSNHTIRQRGRVLCLLVKGKRKKKRILNSGAVANRADLTAATK